MTITVKIKSVYGKEKVYPACDKSLLFAEIARTKTLQTDTINKIKELGYKIVVEQQTL